MIEQKDKSFKQTPQRLAILECLKGNKSHPSAEDIFHKVKKKFPTMSFATVYNNLEAMKKRGIIHNLTIDSERMRYDPNTSYHHHIICVDCKKIIDVSVNIILHIPEEDKCDFDILGNHIEFYGTCPDCMQSESRTAKIQV